MTKPPGGVASPCINICRMHPASGLCEGCLRTLDEIAAWGSAPDDRKLAILAAVAQRRQRLDPDREGLRCNCEDGG